MSTGPFATGWRVSTGFLGEPHIVSVVEGKVWLAFTGQDGEQRKLASFDLTSGRPGPTLELPAPFDSSFDLIKGPLIIQHPRAGSLSAFDIAAGQLRFAADFPDVQRLALHDDLLLLTRATTPLQLVIADPRTGDVIRSVPLPALKLSPGRTSRLFFAARRAIVLAENGLVGVDLDTGAIVLEMHYPSTSSIIEGPVNGRAIVMDGADLICIDIAEARVAWRKPHLGFSNAAISEDGHLFLAHDVTACCYALATGALVWIKSVNARMTGKEIRALRLGRDDIHLIGNRAKGVALTAFNRRTGAHGASVSITHLPDKPARYDLFASPVLPRAIASEKQLELQFADRRIIRLPLPAGRYTASEWTTDRLLIAGRDLIGIDVKSLPAEPTAGLVLTNVASPTAADAPAEVTLVPAAPILMLKHPLYGTVRVSRTPESPPVRVGDQIILEDVTLLPGGVTKIGGWRLASTFNAPSEIVLGAEALPDRDPLLAWEAVMFP